jgi:glycerophosphoryl diester phosphodiesterase
MSEDERPYRLTRRSALIALGASGAAATGAALLAGTPAAAAAAAPLLAQPQRLDAPPVEGLHDQRQNIGLRYSATVTVPADESPQHMQQRLAAVQRLRAAAQVPVGQPGHRPIVMCHRGFSAAATEDTVEAWKAGLDYGGDGIETDIRTTADGVLVMYHDDTIERILGGIGPLELYTYKQVLEMEFRRYGRDTSRTHVPTVVAVFELARQRNAFLHLDFKQPGQDQVVAALLDEMRMWDHVIECNNGNSGAIQTRPEYHRLRPKAPGLYNTGRDLDRAATAEDLAKPGEWILVNDPRMAAKVLGRPAYRPVPLPSGLSAPIPTADVEPDVMKSMGLEVDPEEVIENLSRRINVNDVNALLGVLRSASLDERFTLQPEGSPAEAARTARLVERAWAAHRLGLLLEDDPRRRNVDILQTLEQQVTGRTVHRNWIFHGIDAAHAIQTLARLGATRSVPVVLDWARAQHPELAALGDQWGLPSSWADWVSHAQLPRLLGAVPTPQGREFLEGYVNFTDEQRKQFGQPFLGEAASALLSYPLGAEGIGALLNNPSGVVRAAIIAGCVDQRIPGGRQALHQHAPDALSLPRAY